MQLPALCTAVIATLLLPGLIAQTPQEPLTPPTSLFSGIVPIHTGTDEQAAPYGIWGAVEPYFKVSFHGDMTFIPYLGKDYPQNQPWSWHTTSVTAGSEALLQDGRPPEPVRASDTRYEYRFGGITEAYDLRKDALEQTFVIHSRPAHRGDLVVRGRIETLLHAAPVPSAHQELVFLDHENAEIVGYGAAFAVDARGRTLPIATAWDGARISLTVPESFVEEATFPVTIDPLLTRRLIASSNPVGLVDVCRDDDGDQVMFVYNRIVSIVDFDAFARIANDALTTSSPVFSDTATWSNPVVSCATCGVLPMKYCLVIVRSGGPMPRFSIRYQVRVSGDTTFSSAVQTDITTPVGSHYTNPDVGGTLRVPSSDHFLIAFQRDIDGSSDNSEIWAVPIDVSGVTGVGGGVLGTLVYMRNFHYGSDAAYPSVNQATGSFGHLAVWLVCWQEWSNDPTETAWDIVVRRISSTSFITNQSLVLRSNTRQKLGPRITGHGERYALAYAASSTNQAPGKVVLKTGHGVDVVRFDWPQYSGPYPVVLSTTRVVDSNRYTSRRWQLGGLSYDHLTESHFSYILGDSATGNNYVGRVGYNGRVTEGPLVRVDGPPSSGTALGGLAFDDDNERWVLGWGKGGEVRGNHFVYRRSGLVQHLGLSCGPATIDWRGGGANQQIGCEFSYVRLTGMVTNSISLLAVGFRARSTPLPIPPFGSACSLYVNILATTPIQVGATADYPLPLREELFPATVYIQGFYTNSAATRFYATEQLRVPIIR